MDTAFYTFVNEYNLVNGNGSRSGELFFFEVEYVLRDLNRHFDDAFFCLIKSYRAGCPFPHPDPPLEHKKLMGYQMKTT